MATYYVSNAATNGYAVGSDSNTTGQAVSKSTPWLTIAHAMSAASGGDTLILNGCTFVETAYLNPGKQLTVKADAGLTATIQDATGSDSRVIHFSQASQGSVLGAAGSTIVLDGQNANSGCLTTDSSNQLSSLTIIGVQAKNFTQYGMRLFKNANFVMNDANWSIDVSGCTNATSAAIRLDPGSSSDAYKIANGKVTGTFASGVSTNAYGIFQANPGAAGGTVSVIGVTCALVCDQATGTQQAMMFNLGLNHTIQSNTITVTAPNQTSSNLIDGIAVGLSATGLTSSSVLVQKNTVTLPIDALGANGFGGHGILVGQDGPASAGPVGPTGYNGAGGVVVSQNTIVGGNHGLLVSWISGALIWGNTLQNGVLGAVDKHGGTNYGGTYKGTPNVWCGNVINYIQDSTGVNGCLYGKASVGTIFCNNLVLLDAASYQSPAFRVNNDPQGTVVAASGIVYKNNVVYSSANAPTSCVLVANDTSTASFASNDYYSANGVAANAWSYQGVASNTLGAWQGAQEATAMSADPKFYNFSGGDYRVSPLSSLHRAGTYAHAWDVDFRGRPFWVNPTIGAYESTSGDRAATRTRR